MLVGLGEVSALRHIYDDVIVHCTVHMQYRIYRWCETASHLSAPATAANKKIYQTKLL